MDVEQILGSFRGMVGTFPCKYLGLPLGLKKPTRGELQQILDKIASALKTWKGKLMDRAARLHLVNTAKATYHLMAFLTEKWFIRKIESSTEVLSGVQKKKRKRANV